MSNPPSRRAVLSSAALATASAAMVRAEVTTPRAGRPESEPFGFCLNTSTISGSNLSLVQEIEIARKAGYQAIEPWIREIEAHVKSGGSLGDLRKQLTDANLTVADAIGFASWIVDDPAERAKGLEQMKRDMDMVAQIGGTHIAAPPAGAQGPIDLDRAAERYGALLELGQKTGVMPLLELWGFSKALGRLSEVAYVAIQSGRPDASMLLDIYHLYKGGSDFNSLDQINGGSLHIIHVNDYPANPPREQISDAHRVFPGDGVAPLDKTFRGLRDSGFRGFLSLELFNHDYWKQSPQKVADEGLRKTRAAVKKSLG